MRRRVSVAAVILSAALVPGAGATLLPPPKAAPQLQSVQALTLPHSAQLRVSRTCMVRSKLARRLAPVACEQPPRSQLLIAATLFGD